MVIRYQFGISCYPGPPPQKTPRREAVKKRGLQYALRTEDPFPFLLHQPGQGADDLQNLVPALFGLGRKEHGFSAQGSLNHLNMLLVVAPADLSTFVAIKAGGQLHFPEPEVHHLIIFGGLVPYIHQVQHPTRLGRPVR